MPLSQELQQLIIHVIESTWNSGPWESGPETVCLLNCLNADMNDLSRRQLECLLRHVICGPGGLKLYSHYWSLLDRLVVVEGNNWHLESGDWNVMRALWEAEDWEKLEDWMLVVWKWLFWYATPELMEDIQQVTLDLLSQRPSALQRFENICGEESSDEEELSDQEEPGDEEEESNYNPKHVLQEICKQAASVNTEFTFQVKQ